LTPGAPLPGGRLLRDGRTLVDFSSNDYLGLRRHPLLIERAQSWAGRWGTGAGASRLVVGTLDLHRQVEAKIAALKGTEDALIFGSGWQANAAVLPALFDREGLGGDGRGVEALVFTDRLNHASLHHGCAAAGVRQIRFRHNDLNHLEELLKAREGEPGRRFIVTESVFSMDGDRAPVAALADLAERWGAFLYIDEAHATGVLGPGGKGLSAEAPGRVDLIMGTFSKALGGFGAYVAGSKVLCDYLVNRCGGFIYATAPPPAVLGAMDAALDLVPALDAERAHVAGLAADLRAGLRRLGLSDAGSTTQIVPAVTGSEASALDLSAKLAEAGFLGVAIRPPTVPAGASRIRFALSAAHSADDLAALLDALTQAYAP
ncbi:MAG TPA: aminotransferase class I/II-fold pyridoxal phosphate-dependent enzyme, partial [Azospirillaceae bacterium]|nr:aminotransferase class I/II-fold pyridoxal phosphate-dependent enzyme [Azospirillaceae bacterium]